MNSSFAFRTLFFLAATALFGLSLVAQSESPDAPHVTVEQTVTGKKDAANQSAGAVTGYRAADATTATRTATTLAQVPQAIQVVPHALMEDQNPVTFSEVLQNVSGIQGRSRTEFNNGAYQIRGFLYGQVQFDGLPMYDNGADPDSLVNVERVEVLKGPSSLLYGGGAGDGVGAPVGGTINLVYKQPTATPFVTLETTLGSNRQVHPTLDANTPLDRDGKWLFRVTGEYENAEHDIAGFERERAAVYPTLSYHPDRHTEFSLQLASLRRRQSDYAGLPAVGTLTGQFRTDPATFIGSNQPKSQTETDSVTLRYRQQWSGVWSGNVAVRVNDTKFEQPGFFVFGADPLPGTESVFALGSGFLGRGYDELTVQPTVNGTFSWGSTQHRLLIGVDFTRIDDESLSLFDVPLQMIDLANPILPERPRPTGTFSNSLRDNRYQTRAVYVQDQVALGAGFNLLVGLRATQIELDTRQADGSGFHTKDDQLTDRVGLTSTLSKHLNLFVGYGEGFRQVPFVTTVDAPKPELSDQLEFGLKLRPMSGWSGSLVWYRLDRENVATPDPTNPFFQIQTGLQRAEGLEADLLWQNEAGLAVLAAYAYQDAAIRQDNLHPVGNRLTGVPRHSGRLWARYTVGAGRARGMLFGVGLYASGKQAVDLQNRWTTDAYQTVDALISRQWGRFRVALNGKNLIDETYFEPYQYLFGEVTPGDRRALYGSLGVTF